MIISASRYTDIPAFYTEWLMNRIRAGHCTAPNPSNTSQSSYVSLAPRDVDVIVFWTRNARPMMPHLAELDERGYLYYFQYTVMGNPRRIDPRTPALEEALQTFCELADRVGPERVIWRYDPIVLTTKTNVQFHRGTFERIARALRGRTRRCVVSIVDDCLEAHTRLRELAADGYDLTGDLLEGKPDPQLDELMPALARLARDNEMEIRSCSEKIDLQPYGVQPGKCVDDEYISKVFGISVTGAKDPFETRQECGCVTSRDIGVPDTCLHGCEYCYAFRSYEQNKASFDSHDPGAPSLAGKPG